jgi:hypothetical protein
MLDWRGNMSTPVWDMRETTPNRGQYTRWLSWCLNWAPFENTTVLITNFIYKSTSQGEIILNKSPTFWTVKEDILRRYYVTAQHVVSLPSCSAAAKQMASIGVTKPVKCHFWAESQIVVVSSFTYAGTQYKSCLLSFVVMRNLTSSYKR